MSNDQIKEFTIGEEVRHSSMTGPSMSVLKISEDKKEITCKWFDKDWKTASFAPEELLKKPSSPGFRISAIGGRNNHY